VVTSTLFKENLRGGERVSILYGGWRVVYLSRKAKKAVFSFELKTEN